MLAVPAGGLGIECAGTPSQPFGGVKQSGEGKGSELVFITADEGFRADIS